MESVLNVAFLGHNCCTIHEGIAVGLLLDHRLLMVSVLLQSKLVLWINSVFWWWVWVVSGAEASVPEALFPERDPVFTEVANCCLQPIIICLLPAAHRSEVLIVLSMGKRLLRKKRRCSWISRVPRGAALLFGWLFFFFWEGFLRLKAGKEGNAFGILVLFFNAPYGHFIN